MAILITGVGGFIGQHLARYLVQRHFQVIGTDKLQTIPPDLSEILMEYRCCDLSDEQETKSLCKGIDVVVHLAGEASVTASLELFERDTLTASKNLIEAIKRASVEKIIYLSSYKAVNNNTHYADAKLQVENLLVEDVNNVDVNYTVLRCAVVFGPGMKSSIVNWLRRIQSTPLLTVPQSRSVLPMIGIEDLCAAISVCVENENTKNKTYLLSDGHNYRINDIEKAARLAFGKKSDIASFPRWLLYLGARLGDFLTLFGRNIPLNSGIYKTLFYNEAVEDQSFNRDTGFLPNQNFLEEIPDIFLEPIQE